MGALAGARGRGEVEQGRASAAEERALVGGGHVAAAPVRRAADGAAARIGHHDEAGEVVVLRAEAVVQPRAEAGFANENAAGVHLQTAGRVRRSVAEHRADHTDVVGEFRGAREEAADLESALAVFLERKRRLHEVADGPAIRADLGFAAIGLAVEFRQRGLGVKGVHLAGAAVHEEEDAVLGLGGEVRLFRGERTQRGSRRGGVRRLLEEAVRGEAVEQREAGEAAADLPEEFAARAGARGGIWDKAG